MIVVDMTRYAGTLHYRCDVCDPVDAAVFEQGKCERELFDVELGLRAVSRDLELVALELTGLRGRTAAGQSVTVHVDLCRAHVRALRSYVVWGASFCKKCGGLMERTGRTKPIERGEGVWQEYACENLLPTSAKRCDSEATWEAFD